MVLEPTCSKTHPPQKKKKQKIKNQKSKPFSQFIKSDLKKEKKIIYIYISKVGQWDPTIVVASFVLIPPFGGFGRGPRGSLTVEYIEAVGPKVGRKLLMDFDLIWRWVLKIQCKNLIGC